MSGPCSPRRSRRCRTSPTMLTKSLGVLPRARPGSMVSTAAGAASSSFDTPSFADPRWGFVSPAAVLAVLPADFDPAEPPLPPDDERPFVPPRPVVDPPPPAPPSPGRYSVVSRSSLDTDLPVLATSSNLRSVGRPTTSGWLRYGVCSGRLTSASTMRTTACAAILISQAGASWLRNALPITSRPAQVSGPLNHGPSASGLGSAWITTGPIAARLRMLLSPPGNKGSARRRGLDAPAATVRAAAGLAVWIVDLAAFSDMNRSLEARSPATSTPLRILISPNVGHYPSVTG